MSASNDLVFGQYRPLECSIPERYLNGERKDGVRRAPGADAMTQGNCSRIEEIRTSIKLKDREWRGKSFRDSACQYVVGNDVAVTQQNRGNQISRGDFGPLQ